MNSKATILAAVSLLAITPLALCSCGDRPPSTEDSAGTPAGWTGKKMDMKAAPSGTAASKSQPGTATSNRAANGTKP